MIRWTLTYLNGKKTQQKTVTAPTILLAIKWGGLQGMRILDATKGGSSDEG